MAFTVDRHLLERAARRERAALDALVSTVTPHIEGQLRRYPVAREDRRDLLQSTLIQLVTHVGSFRGDANFATWLYRVTANEALMVMRSQRRRRSRLVEGMDLDELESLPAANEASALTRVDRIIAEQARNEVVRRSVDGLSNDDRDVVVLYYYKDLALQEIAKRLSLTESAVRSRLHRARARLRGVLAGSPAVVETFDDTASQQEIETCADAAAA